MYDVWLEVSKKALEHNYKALRKNIAKDVKICAVVKANAYGHDIITAAKTFVDLGCDFLAVTHFSEAERIRESGIKAKILLYIPVSYCNLEKAIFSNISLTATCIEDVKNISNVATQIGRIANIHIKIDSGTGRSGIYSGDILYMFEEIKKVSNINVEGIYTHFARPGDIDIKFTLSQFEAFTDILDILKKNGYKYGIAHACNSAAAVRFSNMHLDMVRLGTILYGQFPSIYSKNDNIELVNTWKLKCRICQIREFKQGTNIGADDEFVAKKDMTVAVLPIGYSDGYTLISESKAYKIEPIRYFMKKYFNKQYVYINGNKCNVAGRICMQMCMVDITDIKDDVKLDDVVNIPCTMSLINPLIPRILID